MRDEALEVARNRPRQSEKPHANDRDGEGEHRRTFRCARDEIARRGHQADAAEDGRGAEAGRQRDARARRSRDGEESAAR